MQYSSTYVRWERRGDRAIPVRVTKSWVTAEGLRGKLKARAFIPTRVTELRMRDVRGDRETAPEPWTSWDRVESRQRLLGLVVKYALPEGGESILTPEFAGQRVLGLGDLSSLSWRQANAPMDAEPESREWFIRRDWAELRGFHDDQEDS